MSSDADVDVDDLEPGDRFDMPGGPTLVIQGVAPADEAPDADDGPLYQADLRRDDGTQAMLYRPHNIRQGVEGGAEYDGQEDVDEPARPFWCAGCEFPYLDSGRHSAPMLDVPVCSYGCRQTVEQERRVERLEDDR